MCGRFTLRNTKKIKEDFGVEREPSFNISPGQSILTVHKKIEIMRWYFNPEWAKKPMNLINARSETLHEKPSFRDARRCVIPVDGWYEWYRQDGKKQPYFFHNNNDLFLLAEKEMRRIEKSNEDISRYKPLVKLYDRADIINDLA